MIADLRFQHHVDWRELTPSEKVDVTAWWHERQRRDQRAR